MTPVACAECRDLSTHDFRTPDDLIHALRVAAEEMNRGVLARIDGAGQSSIAEHEALDSALAAGAMPGRVRYGFRCAICGDRFSLEADMATGAGRWAREEA